MAQLYIGRKSLVSDVYGMRSEKEFVNTLLDNITKRGAMDKLITDSAQVEQSKRVQDILRSLIINHWKSEPHYQHQNFAERRWQNFKHNVQWYAAWRKIPGNIWLLLCQWVSDVMNLTSERSLGWRPPLEVLENVTKDISILLMFLFWDKVYIKRYKDNNYSGQIGSDLYDKIPGRFVGFAWDVGHALTFRVLTDDTQELVPRSQLMLADDPENNLNLKEPLPNRPNIITMKRETGDPEKDAQVVLPTIDSIRAPFAEDAEDITKHRSESKTDKVEVPLVEESASTRAQQTDQQVQVETVESEEAEQGINDDAEELFPSKEKSKPATTQSSKKKVTFDKDAKTDEDNYRSPMDNPPLRDRENAEWVEAEEQDLPPHLRKPKEGEPLNLKDSLMDNPNPTINFYHTRKSHLSTSDTWARATMFKSNGNRVKSPGNRSIPTTKGESTTLIQ